MNDYVVHILQVPTHVRTIESVVLSELLFSDQNMDDWDRKIVALICKKNQVIQMSPVDSS